jgi:hypothetical protein
MSIINVLFLLGLVFSPLHLVKSESPPSPQLKVTIADAAKQISLSTSTADLDAVVYLEEVVNRPVTDLNITLTPLQGAQPGQIPVEGSMVGVKEADSLSRVSLPALGMLGIRLQTELPVLGVYTGSLSLQYAGLRETYTLHIERTTPKTVFSVNVLPVGPLDRFPLIRGKVPLRLIITETAGQKTRIYPPTVELAVMEDENVVAQAQFKRIVVLDESGAPLATENDGTVSLDPYESRALIVELRQAPSAGRYQATIRVHTPDGVQVTQTAIVRSRHSWILAWLVIIAGVMGGLGLRVWVATLRPQMTSGKEIAYLIEDMASYPQAQKDALGVLFEQRLKRMSRELLQGQYAGAVNVEKLQDRWLGIVDLVNLEEGALKISADLVTTARQHLDQARAALARWQDDQVEAAKKDLEAARSSLREAKRIMRVRPLEEISAKLLEYQNVFPDAAKEMKLDAARSKLEAAIGKIREGKEVDDIEAQAIYTEAYRVYLQALIVDLNNRLPDSPPECVETNAWQSLRNSVLAENAAALKRVKSADGETLGEVHRQFEDTLKKVVQILYPALREQIEKLQKDVSELLSDSTSEAAIKSKPTLEAADQSLMQAHTHIQQVDQHLRNNNLLEALQMYDQAQAVYQAAQKNVSAVGVKLMGNGAERIALLALPVPVKQQAILPAGKELPFKPTAPPIPTASQLNKRLIAGNVVMALVIAFLAGLIGLQFLWDSNPVFGRLTDYITALLWGFGLYELGDVTLAAGPKAIAGVFTRGATTDDTVDGAS